MLYHVVSVAPHLLAAPTPAPAPGPNTENLVKTLQGWFGPLFLGIVSIVAIFFLFTREITRFVQFLVLAVVIGVVFYTPGVIKTIADGLAKALGS